MNGKAYLAFLRQLRTLRWIAIAGQTVTVALIIQWLEIPLPWIPLTVGISALLTFNLYVSWRLQHGEVASDAQVLLHILADITVLAWLIAWSGGIENPFASLFLMPIALSILALPTRLVIPVAIASITGYLLSTTLGRDLPPASGVMLGAFGLHKLGMLANFLVSAAVILLFFTRVAAAWRRSEREVAQLREKFTRNEGIVALATHAASVAHELNTPLGTLTLMVEDLSQEAQLSLHHEDLATLKSLLEICRDRVRALAAPAGSGVGGEMLNSVDLNHIIQQWQLVRPTVDLRRTGVISGFEKVDVSIGHLLQALLNNAADASEQAGAARVDLHLDCGNGGLRGEIRDYGVGFEEAQPPLPAELFNSSKPGGLGIGLALSHATVERLGGALSMKATEGRGVCVEFTLPRAIA